jgi:hypothetical protein
MAKHDTDPVLRELVRSVNDSGHATVPVTVMAHGAVLAGALIAEKTYFAELVERNPLMSALEPRSELLGKDYSRDVTAESDHHLHLRAARIGHEGDGAEGLWRVSLHAVDAWSLHAPAEAEGHDDRGPFARLLGSA